MENVSFDCYNTLTIGIAIIELCIIVVSDLSFTVVLYFFLFEKVYIEVFSLEIFLLYSLLRISIIT